jgi:heat shock protein HslJ
VLHDAVDSDNQRLDALFGKTQPPLQLDFSADRVNVSNACNRISGGYHVVDGHLIVASLLQTRMACADPTLMQRETTINALLQHKPTLILSIAEDGTPMLTLAASSGQTLIFAGKPDTGTRENKPS